MSQLLDACAPIQNVQIRGNVTYSRIHKKIEGEELQAQNEKRKARGNNMLINSPYYILVIENATIINAQQLPPEVVNYFNSKIKSYQNPDGTFTNRYYAMSKSKFEPIVAYSNEAGADMANGTDIKLRGELESGMNVTIGACIYKASIGKGVGFDYVLLNEPIKYYNGSGATAAITAALASQGIVYKNESIEPDDDADTSTPYGDEVLPFSTPVGTPTPIQTAPAPAQIPTVPPASQTPVQAAPNYGAPATAVPQGMPVPSVPAPATPPQQTAVPPTMPNVQIPPQVPTQQPTSGIQYNPLQYGNPPQQ